MYFFSRRVRLTRNGWKAAPRPATRVLFRCFSSYLHTCMFVILLLSHKHANVCPLEVLQKGPSQTEKQRWHHHRIGSSTGVSVRINSARCVCVCAAQVLAHLHTLCKDGKAVGPANPKKCPRRGQCDCQTGNRGLLRADSLVLMVSLDCLYIPGWRHLYYSCFCAAVLCSLAIFV